MASPCRIRLLRKIRMNAGLNERVANPPYSAVQYSNTVRLAFEVMIVVVPTSYAMKR